MHRHLSWPLFIALAAATCSHGEDASYAKRAPILNRLTATIGAQSPVRWQSRDHTPAPVPVAAVGDPRYTARLSGGIRNIDIAAVMKQALSDGVSVILVIGDGFGESHRKILATMRPAGTGRVGSHFERIANTGARGVCDTRSAGGITTDSAAAATALACGVTTANGVIGRALSGARCDSALALARRRGMATGLITDTRVTDATPAAFFAHVANRRQESAIAAQLVDGDTPDIILGGGACYFIPRTMAVRSHPALNGRSVGADLKSRRDDDRDLVTEMAARGYRVVTNTEILISAARGSNRILGLFAGHTMNTTIDRDDENTGEPGIDLMARTALSVLARNPKGFFLMIECGQLDLVSHMNDTGAVVGALREMDDVLRVCLDHARANSARTLLIATGDHETGAPVIDPQIAGTRAPTLSLDAIARQRRSLRRIVIDARSTDELRTRIDTETAFRINLEEAKIIWGQ